MTTPFDITTAPLEAGVTLIEASAGTGKTYSITGLILRLILEKQLQIRDILAVTFTEAATQELRDRIRRRLQSALEDLHGGASKDDIVNAFLKKGDTAIGIRQLDLAIQSFDEAQIFTIHGFCQRMLNDHAFESGTRFDTTLVTDPKPLFEEVARDFWRLRFYEAKPLLPKLAMAWKRSLEDWVELLERTRSHPDLVILPPAEAEPGEALVRRVETAFAAVREEWTDHQADIEIILRHDGNLSRSEKNFRDDRVDELLAKVAEACGDFESADPESIKALSGVTSEAIAAGTKGTGTPPKHRFFTLTSDFCQAVDALFNRLAHEFLEFAQAELPKRKARTNTVTYDDLITGLRDALRQEGGSTLAAAIGGKYSAALIDEFQDTDPAQYEIFRTIFGSKEHRLFLIGDPRQAIYGFRGADVFTYFQANTIADQAFTLTTNWRAEAPLLAAINRLFLQTEQPFIFPEIQYHQVHAPKKPIVRHLTTFDDAATALRFRLVTPAEGQARASQFELVCRWVSDDIAALAASGVHLGKNPLRYRDMAILVRKHSQAEMLQTVLRERGIRSVVQSDKSVFASEEARELQRFLQGVIDPRRDSLLKAALATTLIGFDAQMLFALERDDPKRQLWLDRFTDWKLRWSDGCFTAMFRHLLVTQQVRARLVQLPAGERRLTNFLHLAELLHEAESTMSLAPDAVCSWLRAQRESERVSEDRFQLRLESDDDAVQIVTIHKSKGLEYPIVFCPFLWTDSEYSGHKELLFHDRDDPKKLLTFDLRGKKAGAKQHQDWQSEEVRAEELRLLYVALTRAMNRCYIYLPEEKTDKSPLAHLFAPSKKESLFDQVRGFAQTSEGCVSASSEPAQSRGIPDETPVTTTLQSRIFNGKISRVSMTASFSGLNLAAPELEELALTRWAGPDAPIAPRPDSSDLSIFTFDRGRRTGDFFHDVLEHMDFQDLSGLSELLESRLSAYGFPGTLHRPAIRQILDQLMEVELDPGLSLRDIPKTERLSEVEFTYPLARLTPASLAKVINKCANLTGDIRERMGTLHFDPVEGFMNGFIDLLFRFKNRYYLIDWKSNWLGGQQADYGPEGMRQAMLGHNYYLQYHLYTLAADLFLERCLPGYDYETHSGGVYYIFLRGIDPKDPRRGIFRDRPAAKTVKNLRALVLMSRLVEPEFADIDRHFADFIGRFGGDDTLVPLAAAMLSRAIREGNICLPLGTAPTQPAEANDIRFLEWPAVTTWRTALANSSAVGGPDAQTPLVVDEWDRLYLRRYWNYQQRLAVALRKKAAANHAKSQDATGTQAEAIDAAANNALTIISGGPGTGKTTTVLHILARLLQEAGNENLRIALAAPTGKAAARLEETLRMGLETLDCPDEVKTRIPVAASTIHRLLGVRGNSIYFRHDRQNPLPLDLLVIDEASMVALPLLAKLLDALPERCRVILLGDRDQLASVEPGAVLADIVDAAVAPGSLLRNAVVTLKKNYRFSERSGIHHLCGAVRQGDATKAMQILREQSYPDLVSSEISEPREWAAKFAEAVRTGFAAFAAEKEPAGALSRLGSFRVLSALRRGPFGVEGLNRKIEGILRDAGLIPPHVTSLYAGKPILITQNDYQLRLHNGDVGVLLPDGEAKENPEQLWAWFIGQENTLRRFAPARLPQHDAAYAMTVHKSQGSEFDRALFILPDRDAPVLTRELIYTGLTRARSQVELWWNEAVFAQAVTRRAERNSGLRDLLISRETKIPPARPEQLQLFGEEN